MALNPVLAVALFLAFASPDALDILAVTTVAGNVGADLTARNARIALEHGFTTMRDLETEGAMYADVALPAAGCLAAAILVIYLILGMLYESFVHPITGIFPHANAGELFVEWNVKLDAACVVVNLFDLPGRPHVREACIRAVLAAKRDCERYNMPLMVEPLVMKDAPNGGYQVNGDIDRIVHLAAQPGIRHPPAASP